MYNKKTYGEVLINSTSFTSAVGGQLHAPIALAAGNSNEIYNRNNAYEICYASVKNCLRKHNRE